MDYGKFFTKDSTETLRQRKPWYKMKRREVPTILFTYLDRRNDADVLPLTGLLYAYSIYDDKEFVEKL